MERNMRVTTSQGRRKGRAHSAGTMEVATKGNSNITKSTDLAPTCGAMGGSEEQRT
jgi:hypothetical protein